MSKPLFVLQPFCEGPHCVSCRSESFGQAKWIGWSEHFEMPGVWGQESCPKKLPIGWKPPPASGPTRVVEKIVRNERMIAAVKRFRKPGDAGVGDTLERILHKGGGGIYKKAFSKIMGRSCGCGDAKARLNQDFPYPVE